MYKATDIDEVVADLYMDSPENLSIVSDPGSLSETVALPNNQVNDRQKVRPEREIELFTEAYTCMFFQSINDTKNLYSDI